MAMPIKFGVGSPLASGKQYLSWIHVDDLCALFIKAIEEKKVIGPVNATTGWITNKMFTEAIAKIVNRPLWLPNIPAFVLRIVIGEMAEMLINGSKVSPEKAHALGYNPLYPTLDLALKNLLLK